MLGSYWTVTKCSEIHLTAWTVCNRFNQICEVFVGGKAWMISQIVREIDGYKLLIMSSIYALCKYY
jgi:hypothetical protein